MWQVHACMQYVMTRSGHLAHLSSQTSFPHVGNIQNLLYQTSCNIELTFVSYSCLTVELNIRSNFSYSTAPWYELSTFSLSSSSPIKSSDNCNSILFFFEINPIASTHKGEHLFVFLCLFRLYNVLQFHPCSCKWQNFNLFVVEPYTLVFLSCIVGVPVIFFFQYQGLNPEFCMS